MVRASALMESNGLLMMMIIVTYSALFTTVIISTIGSFN